MFYVLSGHILHAPRRLALNRFAAAMFVAGVCMLIVPSAPARQATTQPADQGASIAVDGDVDHPGSWTADQLADQFKDDLKTIKYSSRGKDVESRCVPLLKLIDAVGPTYDQEHPNQILQFVISVSAGAKYSTAFSMGELLHDFGKEEVWVALDADGKPLTGTTAPARLVIPADGKQARWVYGITHIHVIRLSPSAHPAAAAPAPAP